MAEQKSSSTLTAPLRGAASVLRKVPGAGTVTRAAEGTLDKVGVVSPRGRRMAVYAGAGLLGAAGVVEWPVALTGAAVAWLTQPRPAHPQEGVSIHRPDPAQDIGTAALRSAGDPLADEPATGTRPAAPYPPAGTEPPGPVETPPAPPTPSAGEPSGPPKAARHTPPAPAANAPKPSHGPLGPTARPDRTTL
ncbi:hypothetical protein NX794_06740 [Streptomyces sp. LP11]|uniref:Uncharacterized protein n=1 Tax=Streptomyces pyxinicus TaxID=2970331 RepID=A0ABT2AXE3_9ACTN|nr:hypothetical protein [Streptomyces sp. LP11]MCS0600928.1 hypothetical protein [Streptomyces sp. LP11]